MDLHRSIMNLAKVALNHIGFLTAMLYVIL